MILHANCKINLGLDIIRRREDGFHELESIMLPVVDLFDTLTVEPANKTQFTSLGIKIDCPAEENLSLRAARLMQQKYAIGDVSITLDKRVPFGAGLGGGSSDATSVILAINELYNLNLAEDILISLASELGSDTPFFVRNRPQFCGGRGEVMEDISLPLNGLHLLLIKPEGVNISTREAFSGIKPSVPQMPLKERIALPISQWQECIKNDFETHIFRAHPQLQQIKQRLLDQGALYASMSGSGSTIYGIFKSLEGVDTSGGYVSRVMSEH